MRRISLSSVACLALPLFFCPHYLINDAIFEHKMCGLILSTMFVCNFPHSNTNEARYYHSVNKCSCNVAAILVRF